MKNSTFKFFIHIFTHYLKLFTSIIFLVINVLSSFKTLIGQETVRPNTIETRLFPTYNSDFSYFFLRRDKKMYEQMVSTEMTSHEDGAIDIRTKAFIPIFNNEKWSYSIPVYFDQYQFISDNNSNQLNINNLFGQSALVYRPNEKWDLLHIIEFRFKGAESHFTKKEGNFMAQFITAQYKINNKFSVIAGALLGIGWNQNRESYIDAKPAFMFKWSPNKYLNLMLGVPGTALEWSAPGGFDLMAHALIDGNEINTSIALRKNVGSHFDISFRYLHEGFDDLYTPDQAVPFINSNDLQQISQYQDKFQVELTIRPEPNTILQLIGGHSQNRDLNVLDVNADNTSVSSKDGLYFGVNLARTILL